MSINPHAQVDTGKNINHHAQVNKVLGMFRISDLFDIRYLAGYRSLLAGYLK
jgi:hypothetical protein